MSGKDTQTGLEGEREDDATGLPEGNEEQDPKGRPTSDRQKTETVPKP